MKKEEKKRNRERKPEKEKRKMKGTAGSVFLFKGATLILGDAN